MHTLRAMGNEILAAMEELGMDRIQFAEAVGVHRTTVMRWERGDREAPPPVRRLVNEMLERHRRKPRSRKAEGAAA